MLKYERADRAQRMTCTKENRIRIPMRREAALHDAASFSDCVECSALADFVPPQEKTLCRIYGAAKERREPSFTGSVRDRQ